MCTDRRSGFTLIELIVFIVIVSVALAGVLAVYNVVVKGSADPVREKQAVAAAESLLEEVMHKQFANPASGGYTPTTCPALDAGCNRLLFDDVGDYNGYSTTGVRDVTDPNTTVLSGYNARVSVTQPATDLAVTSGDGASVAAAQIRIVTVTVTDTLTGKDYALTAYKFNND